MTNRNTTIFNEKTFYPAFIKDMLTAEKEVIIYSPFISRCRTEFFKKTLLNLTRKGIQIFIFTRPIEENKKYMQGDIRLAIEGYRDIGVQVIYLKGSIHEKLAVIDRRILWQGSLNILSQKSSKELMMRTVEEGLTSQILSVLNLGGKLITERKFKGSRCNLSLSLNQIIKCSLFVVSQVMMLSLKCVLLIFNILDTILG